MGEKGGHGMHKHAPPHDATRSADERMQVDLYHSPKKSIPRPPNKSDDVGFGHHASHLLHTHSANAVTPLWMKAATGRRVARPPHQFVSPEIRGNDPITRSS
mmetsp:Transcript_20933/g.37801  ORF Transcript_20933/g.37801 Transcript_20933/m.37801 type:complete len:102 (+) Transcript_20933:211-516(+)